MADVTEAGVPPPAHLLLTTLESSDAPWEDEFLSAWARRLFWFFGLMFGFVQAFTTRFTMNVDGVSYLDMARAIARGDWSAAVNGYWSPLYACLLAAALRVLHVSMYWESTIVHAVNFLIFVASMAAFEALLRESCSRDRPPFTAADAVEPLPVWAMQAFGYSLFLYSGLVWITVGSVTPDLGVAAIMYLVATLLLRMQSGHARWGAYFVLGMSLGAGYLTKAALLPLGLVSLAGIPFLTRGASLRRRMGSALIAACVFALTASPLIVALSRVKGRFTFGDTGKIAYVWMVDGISDPTYWQGEGNIGAPNHPVRNLRRNPDVYEFATPVGGTYPPWYDKSYWLDGLKPRMNIAGQFHVLAGSARAYSGFIFEQSGFVVAFIALCALDAKRYSFWRGALAVWPGWIAALAGIGMFALVLVESRYVASFLVIAGLSGMTGIRLLPSMRTRRFVIGLAGAIATLNLFAVGSLAARNLPSSLLRPRNMQWEVAQALTHRGVMPGDTVATIVDHQLGDYWAHLAGAKIVEEIPFEEMPKLAALNQEAHATLFRALQQPGAKAIVTTPAPPEGTGFHWERLGDTDFFMASLTQANQP